MNQDQNLQNSTHQIILYCWKVKIKESQRKIREEKNRNVNLSYRLSNIKKSFSLLYFIVLSYIRNVFSLLFRQFMRYYLIKLYFLWLNFTTSRRNIVILHLKMKGVEATTKGRRINKMKINFIDVYVSTYHMNEKLNENEKINIINLNFYRFLRIKSKKLNLNLKKSFLASRFPCFLWIVFTITWYSFENYLLVHTGIHNK